MTGAMAGSAILNAPISSDKLDTVTLTINNTCNLSCPHCYLQYSGAKTTISDDLLDQIIKSDFRHLAIVGKEPSVHPDAVKKLTKTMKNSGRTTSIITNGILMERFSSRTLSDIEFLDISLDGGPKTYSRYRFSDIVRKIQQARSAGCRKINILHTIYKENLRNIDDMVAVREFVEFDKMLFSPYLTSRNHGKNLVTPISLVGEVLPALSVSEAFCDEPRAFLLVSGLHLAAENISVPDLENSIKDMDLSEKILIFNKDPIEKGFIRVNYDGTVITPFQSLHPEDYKKSEFKLDGAHSLEEIFQTMRKIVSCDPSKSKAL